MANETTTTTLNDTVQGYVISSAMMGYAMEYIVAHSKFRLWSLVGQPSNVLQIPRFTADYTVDDNGATLDGEFDASEGTPISNTAVDTENVQLTVSEYGFASTITDNVYEDSVLGTAFMSQVVMLASQYLALAVEQASCALFSGLSNSVGSTGVDLTIAQAMAAADGIRTRGSFAPDGLVYVFDNQQWSDLKTAAIATSTSLLTYGATGEQFVGASRDASNGLGADRRVGTFYGIPAHETGITPTANSAADVVGACFTPSSPGNDSHATFSYVEKRPFRMEVERDAALRADVAVFTRRCAVGESADFSGTKIVTDL